MRIAVLTSGGDAPGMNAALHAAAKVSIARGHDIFGVRDGYSGLMAGAFDPLGLRDIDGISRYGGTVLGSARAPEMHEAAGRARARDAIVEHRIDGLIVIGGNGSLTGAHYLAAELPCAVVGIPASIDNDVGCTRAAIGVDTAVNTIVEACDRITDTATAHRRVFIVEVMGRECGFLAMRAGLAVEADAILYGERAVPEDELVDRLRGIIRRSFDPARGKRRVLIMKAEGVHIPTVQLVERLRAHMDEDAPGVNVRETVLGHVVRGGRPSQADRVIAQRLAFASILTLEQGKTDAMLGWEVPTSFGEPTDDARVRRVGLADVIAESKRLIDGTSEVTIARLALLEHVEQVLAL